MNASTLSKTTAIACLAALCAGAAFADSPDIKADLDASLKELAALQQRIGQEKIPMVKGLNDLEDKLVAVRLDYQKTARQLDSRNMDLNNLRSELATRRQEKSYISNLLAEYSRNFESRLNIVELQSYRDAIDAANLAPDDSNLSDSEVYLRQVALVEESIKRLQELVGGTAFKGVAAGEDGLLKHGEFVLVGPVALFMSDDGRLVGAAEQRLGSLEPSVVPYPDPRYDQMVRVTVNNKSGNFPFDPSMGNARKIAETHETLGEHLKKGGPVVWPIVGLFFVAVVVALGKWIQLGLVRMPSDRQVQPLLDAMLAKDFEKARGEAGRLKGPAGAMLALGVEHIAEPKDLVEEVMYEEMLTTKLRVNRFVSFLAVCASAAPLLGLLGTVTGIINTFKLITVFGSGDAKTLSSGISEALITTELGLVVAIFALMLHAFLSRKARAIGDRMEQVAILFMNRALRAAPAAE